MGLLDDAIREHLELKRRHGADASEVQRQEHEALGPARRGPEPLEVPAAREPVAATEAPAEEQADADAEAHRAAEREPVDPVLIDPEVDPPAYEEPDDETALEWEHPRQAEPEPQRAAEPEPQPERQPEPEPDAESAASQRTVAFDAADVREAQRPAAREPEPEPQREPERASAPAEPADDDVLEETPDFLQETPEHDRLWFEQRPPRDFDFDG
jgi:hypothetical protein